MVDLQRVTAGMIDGDVGSLCQCCPQLFEVFGEDVAPSRVRGSTGSEPSLCLQIEGVDGVGRMAVRRSE